MDKQREKFVAEIKRLEDAVQKTKSKYLKADYGKRIRRVKKELREYDAYKKSGEYIIEETYALKQFAETL